MLIVESHIDVPTKADGVEGSMRIFLFHPSIPGYPNAKFPGVALFSEIYQVTGPVARFARSIASAGYIVAAPSSYHDFVPSDPLAYDVPGTDLGNALKAKKTLASYDADSSATIDALLALPTCTGRLGATGMCLGGHLAIRCALDPRISAAVAYFATDLHSATLGANNPDDTLARCKEIKGELVCIHGTLDTHVPPAGRDKIRLKLREAGVVFSWFEVAGAQHAFIRDEM
ncbi:hypothetical protein V501_09214, partial [Pseudogymnoascus sp. VKM F-4519 (FW-2642)]